MKLYGFWQNNTSNNGGKYCFEADIIILRSISGE